MTGLTPFQQRRADIEANRRDEAPTRRGARRKFDPETAKARSAERTRRLMEARRRAVTMLIEAHEDEYDALFGVEQKGVDAERGPLPGDES